ncbi:MAG: flagellar basal body L-ring protein FlgH [bacterium]
MTLLSFRGAALALLMVAPAVTSSAQAPVAAAAPVAQPALATPIRHSWTSDRREYVVGDIITVLVDEQTLASANKGQSGSDVQSRQNALDIQPPGAMAVGVDVKVGTDKTASSRQTGNASRDLRFRGEMTVRITSIAPNGVLEVKGTRTVDVDKNKQLLTLTGFVRSEDISHANTVVSSRIADAQILYTLSGDLGATRGGIIGRLVSVFWP